MLSRICLRVGILVALLVAPLQGQAIAAVHPQVAPVTTVQVDPSVPDGLAGWWLAAPDVSITSDQDGSAFYSYGAEEFGMQVFAGVPAYLTDVPDGAYTLSVYTVNAALEVESPVVTVPLKVDSAPPSRPVGVEWSLSGGNTIALSWTASADVASGVEYYAVYRNLTGAPFSPADLIAVVTAPEYDDSGYPPVSGLCYAFQAWDRAGNVSLLSDVLVADVDVTPPSPPADLRAWKNAGGWVRVSWAPAFDAGTGIAGYHVYRSLDGAPMELVATVPAGAGYFDDTDPALATTGNVYYQVVALDRAGLESEPAGPIQAGVDVVAPVAGAFRVTPESQGSSASHFAVSFTSPVAADSASGIAGYEIRYGPVPGTPASSTGLNGSLSIPVAPDPSAMLYVTVRFYDIAGNFTDSPPVAARNVPVHRLAGLDRIATSLAASAAGFESADTVVFASALNYPDALCATPLAATVAGPVLLVAPGPLSDATLQELDRLGVADAYVVGGTAAVSDVTLSSIEAALPGAVTRLAGSTRYDTAARVAAELGIDPAGETRAYVVTGERFPDALAAGPAAYAEAMPILYARATGIPDVTLAVFQDFDIDAAVILGGLASVTPNAESLLPAPVRLAGDSRYDTALEFADWALDDGVLQADSPCIATGVKYPDGLSAGSLAGQAASPVLFVDGNAVPGTTTAVEAHVFDWLYGHRAALQRVYTLGGTAVIRQDLPRDLWQILSVP